MDVHTALAERAIHLVLFIAGAVAVALVVLAGIERAFDRASSRAIRPWHVILPIAVFVVAFAVERAYHALS